uniref:Uncharacterized protein n=1 Tax=candidate division WOR-3 bacterium TaxID=2052148 RepID=A0A7C4X868_UNCW3
MPSKLGHYIFYYVFMPRLQFFIVVGNRSLFFSFCHCEFFSPLSLRGNEVAEAISFVIGPFRDYFVVWFFTRTDGIASPAFGGLAMTEGVRRAQ